MIRVLRSLGLAVAGFFACLYFALILTHIGKPSDRLGQFALGLLVAPVVGLILFFVSFFWPVTEKPLAVERSQSNSKSDVASPGEDFSATAHSSAASGAAHRSKGPRSAGVDWIRLLLSTTLAVVTGCASFLAVRNYALINFNSGGWFDSLWANVLAYILTPVFAIAGFLLVYYAVGLFKRF